MVRWMVGVGLLALVAGCNCGGATGASGFSQVYAATGNEGTHVSLVLDGDDQPLVAFVKEDPADRSNTTLFFTRYDATTSAWTAPVTVDTSLGELPSGRQIWLARDPKDGRLGLAYAKLESFCGSPTSNKEFTIHLSFSTDRGATWGASERVSEAFYTGNDPVNGVEVCNARAPRLAMRNGKVFMAWAVDAGEPQDPQPLSYYYGYYYGESTAAGSWTRTLLPNIGDQGRQGADVLSLALDSAGAPAVTYVMRSLTGYNNAIVYFRPGGAPVVVGDSGGIQNDTPRIALAFDGLKPRVAAKLARSTTDPGATWMYRSDDGAAFTDVRVPDDASDQGGSYLSLDFVGGKGALAYDFGSGTMPYGACGGPKISRSSDAQAWTTCGADDVGHQFLGEYVSARLASSGKLVMAFHASYVDEAAPARFGEGIVLWREP